MSKPEIRSGVAYSYWSKNKPDPEVCSKVLAIIEHPDGTGTGIELHYSEQPSKNGLNWWQYPTEHLIFSERDIGWWRPT